MPKVTQLRGVGVETQMRLICSKEPISELPYAASSHRSSRTQPEGSWLSPPASAEQSLERVAGSLNMRKRIPGSPSMLRSPFNFVHFCPVHFVIGCSQIRCIFFMLQMRSQAPWRRGSTSNARWQARNKPAVQAF